MKKLLIALVVLASTFSFGQVKVEPKQTQYLILNTLTYEMVPMQRDSSLHYYTHTFTTGYEYPNIKQGYYSIGVFFTKANLLQFYQELSNLENLEDGTYKLSCSDRKVGYYYAKKKGSKVIITTEFGYSRYAKFTMENIKLDLEQVKALW
jgi:hypothetical protein